MNYSKVNRALAKEFGAGNVKIIKDKTPEWEYRLWFLDDAPSPETIARAEEIVNGFCPTRWMPEKAYHTDE